MVLRFFVCLAALYLANASLITNLPGAPPVSFKQYAGYFDVGVKHHLHYWFVESQSNPSTDPVLLWLTGGPGCSSLSAFLNENGPLLVNPDGKTLRTNKYSWNLKANVLFIESPAGVGYSYGEAFDYATDDDKVAAENRQALIAFFTEYPQFRVNDFYVTGESYGGIYVPTLVKLILDKQSEYKINIKGMAIGNGAYSEDEDTDTLIQYAYNHGLVDETTWQRVENECCGGSADGCAFHSFAGFGFCPNFRQETIDNCWYGGINPYNMFGTCTQNNKHGSLHRHIIKQAIRKTGKLPPIGFAGVLCLDEVAATTYLNLPEVRKALFVPDNLPLWDMCNDNVSDTYTRLYPDTTPIFKSIIAAGLRVQIYHGDGDMACNFLLGQRFVHKLGYPLTSNQRSFKVEGQVGGFHTQYGNIEFISVRGAGHMVPTDKPAVSYHLLDSFLNKRRP